MLLQKNQALYNESYSYFCLKMDRNIEIATFLWPSNPHTQIISY